eukprot:Unigene3729_Nuclearia_a/m.11382 Unigene3729_Nuclearia_a/g.11382  ORF Unigene3729_Nuclearia_a/g.11382 Unigene3729_Nuclearia_a/m.11382 type:complete len:697 (-) Unigene3729_Nuclearia_a:50-2140(-)
MLLLPNLPEAHELAELAETVDRLNLALDEVQTRKQAVVASKRLLLADLDRELSQRTKAEHAALQTVRQQISAHRQKEKIKIDLERDRLERLRSHIKLDKDLVDKSDASLLDKIKAEGRPYFAELEVLQEKDAKLTDEIAELRRRLDALEQEHGVVVAQKAQVQRSIAAIAENFADERVRLEHEKAELARKQGECDTAERALSELEVSFKTALDSLRKSEEEHAVAVQTASAKQQMALSLREHDRLVEQAIASFRADAHLRAQGRESDLLQLAKVARAVEEAEGVVRDKERLLELRTTALSEKQYQLGDLKAKVALWAQQKNVAVSERNFKEAGKLASDIKTAQTTLDDGEHDLAELQAALDAAQAELELARQAKKEWRSKADDAEKLMAQDKLARLEPQLTELKASYANVSAEPQRYDEAVFLRSKIMATAADIVRLRAKLGINVDKAVTETFSVGPEPPIPSRQFVPVRVPVATSAIDDVDEPTPVEEAKPAPVEKAEQAPAEQAEPAPAEEVEQEPAPQPDELPSAEDEFDSPSASVGDQRAELAAKATLLQALLKRDAELDREIEDAAISEDYDRADELNAEQQRVKAQLALLQAVLELPAPAALDLQANEPAGETEAVVSTQGSAFSFVASPTPSDSPAASPSAAPAIPSQPSAFSFVDGDNGDVDFAGLSVNSPAETVHTPAPLASDEPEL